MVSRHFTCARAPRSSSHPQSSCASSSAGMFFDPAATTLAQWYVACRRDLRHPTLTRDQAAARAPRGCSAHNGRCAARFLHTSQLCRSGDGHHGCRVAMLTRLQLQLERRGEAHLARTTARLSRPCRLRPRPCWQLHGCSERFQFGCRGDCTFRRDIDRHGTSAGSNDHDNGGAAGGGRSGGGDGGSRRLSRRMLMQ